MIFVEFSHILTFSALFVASVFDVRSEKGDVPDVFGATAIVGGILLHAIQSYMTGSLDPLLYCLGAGLVFSIYGFFAYWKGIWGGADALALSALGFGAPYFTATLAGVVRHSANMFLNLVAVAFVYTIAFSLVRAARKKGFMGKFIEKLKSERKRIGLELGLGIIVFAPFKTPTALVFYTLIALSIVTYRFLKVVEDYALVEEVDAEELEGGEVLKKSRIRGVTEDELENLDGKVEIVHGLRFMPVFPLALLLNDAGITLLKYLIMT